MRIAASFACAGDVGRHHDGRRLPARRIYVDITAALRRSRRKAIRAHLSQDPERFVDDGGAAGRYRSAQCNVPEGYAEAFRFEPIFPFADIRDLLPPAPGVSAVGIGGKAYRQRSVAERQEAAERDHRDPDDRPDVGDSVKNSARAASPRSAG